MRLILLRHGVTIGNQQRIVQGHLDGKLTSEGKKQATKAAIWLKEEDIAIIYVSDLARAIDTADIISNHHPNADIITTEQIRERNWGVFEGRPYDDVSKALQSTNIPIEEFKPKDGESRQDLIDRGNMFFDKLVEKHQNETVLVVTHGGLISNILLRLMNLDFQNISLVRPDNTAITIIEINEDKSYQIKILNSIKHLD